MLIRILRVKTIVIKKVSSDRINFIWDFTHSFSKHFLNSNTDVALGTVLQRRLEPKFSCRKSS